MKKTLLITVPLFLVSLRNLSGDEHLKLMLPLIRRVEDECPCVMSATDSRIYILRTVKLIAAREKQLSSVDSPRGSPVVCRSSWREARKIISAISQVNEKLFLKAWVTPGGR